MSYIKFMKNFSFFIILFVFTGISLRLTIAYTPKLVPFVWFFAIILLVFLLIKQMITYNRK
jgi:hypothetical protein